MVVISSGILLITAVKVGRMIALSDLTVVCVCLPGCMCAMPCHALPLPGLSCPVYQVWEEDLSLSRIKQKNAIA